MGEELVGGGGGGELRKIMLTLRAVEYIYIYKKV